MDYRRIRQANDIIGVLEDGDFNAAVTSENEALLKVLRDLAPQKGKGVKGSLTIKIDYELVGNSLEVAGSVAAKAPKPQRGRSFYFLTAEGALSTEHPKQQNMFDDPKVRAMNETRSA